MCNLASSEDLDEIAQAATFHIRGYIPGPGNDTIKHHI